MMRNADMPAMPVGNGQVGPGEVNPSACGLSKREHFAAMAMQGILANRTAAGEDKYRLAAASVIVADALLAELERTK